MTSIIARTDFATAVLQGLPQTSDISQVLLEVATRKADVTFVEPAVAGAYMASNPGTIAPVADVPPLRIFPNVMMVGKGEVELLSTLNIALEELVNTGFVQRVVDKYEQYPGSFERRRPPV
jgi:ABC-type amino acid transport substrate-binding protein